MSIDLNRSHLEQIIERAAVGSLVLESTSSAEYDCRQNHIEANQPLFWQAENPDKNSVMGNLRVVVDEEKETVYVSILKDGESVCHNEDILEEWLKDTLFTS